MKIEQWLTGMVDFDVPSAALQAILINNRVNSGECVLNLTEKEKDLCLADLYMWLSASSTATKGEYISDGGWQHQKSNKTVVDRRGLREQARRLYAKWGSEKAATAKMGMRMKPLY